MVYICFILITNVLKISQLLFWITYSLTTSCHLLREGGWGEREGESRIETVPLIQKKSCKRYLSSNRWSRRNFYLVRAKGLGEGFPIYCWQQKPQEKYLFSETEKGTYRREKMHCIHICTDPLHFTAKYSYFPKLPFIIALKKLHPPPQSYMHFDHIHWIAKSCSTPC